MRRATDALAPLRSYGAVMGMALPMLAGMVSTTVFAGSVLPMLLKAARTRDLSSYSRGNLVLANVGNTVHSMYVFHLPPGPIWLLHAFYTTTSALMLFWWIRYRPLSRPPAPPRRREARSHRRLGHRMPVQPDHA